MRVLNLTGPRVTAASVLLVAGMLCSQVIYAEFLDALLHAEVDYRGERAAQRRLKAARLPIRVSLDDFDFTLGHAAPT